VSCWFDGVEPQKRGPKNPHFLPSALEKLFSTKPPPLIMLV